MKIDYDGKKMTCDCGKTEWMADISIHQCFECEETFIEFGCCGASKIPKILYDYIDSFKTADAYGLA